MPALDRSVLAWMHQHRATVTNQHLANAGVTRDQRKRLVAAGLLERVLDGSYRFTGAPVDEWTRCVAVSTARGHLVIAGPTAGRLWDLRRSPRDGLIHVIAPPASHPCREPWLRAYRTSALDPSDVVERRDAIRLTSPARTLLDLTRFMTDRNLRSAIEHALHRELCTPADLARVAAPLNTRGRPWVPRFVAALAQRHPGAAAQSEWEARVVDELVAHGVTDLERQVEVFVPDFGLVWFDAAIPALRWGLEIDVHPEHLTSVGSARDKARDRKTGAIGWVTERVGGDDLRDRLPQVVSELLRSIARRRETTRLSGRDER